jgi:hypothetical protein
MKKRLVAALLAATILPQPANAALIALYQFDDATNLGRDTSGAGNHATNFGVNSTIAGYQNGAALFVGQSWLTAPVNVGPTSRPSMTWGAWAKPSPNSAGIQTVLSNDNGGYDRQISATSMGWSSNWSTFTGNGVLNSGVQPSTTDWTFLAAVYDQAQRSVTLYVNGQAVSATTSFGGAPDSFTIGRNLTYLEYFQGSMDNVFVYDEALSADRIAQIRSVGFPAVAPSAVPEPATWAMMVFGFGVVGGALRRSKPSRRVRFNLA